MFLLFLNAILSWIQNLFSGPLDILIVSASTDPMFWAAIFTLCLTLLTLRQTALANELKLLPLIIFYIKGQKYNEKSFFIKNVGEGVAYRIKIEVFDLILTDVRKIWSFRLRLGGTNVLGRDDEKELEIYDHEDKKTTSTNFFVHLLDDKKLNSSNKKTITLLVTFYNSIGRKYYSLLEFGQDGLTVAIPPRRFSIKLALILLFRRMRNYDVYIWKTIWLLRRTMIVQPKEKF